MTLDGSQKFMNLSIVQLEMLNILLAVRLFHAQWAGRKILIKCDNETVVSVLRSARPKTLTWGPVPEYLVCVSLS